MKLANIRRNLCSYEYNFTCIEMEEQETVSGKRYHHYTHPVGQADDALHAFVYALIADAAGRKAWIEVQILR